MNYEKPTVESLGNAALVIQGAKVPPPPETNSAEDLRDEQDLSD